MKKMDVRLRVFEKFLRFWNSLTNEEKKAWDEMQMEWAKFSLFLQLYEHFMIEARR